MFTDHAPLVSILNGQPPSSRLSRWKHKLLDFAFPARAWGGGGGGEGEGGGVDGTRMSVKSNDGGGGAIQRGQLLCYKYHCCLCYFGIVWRFRILTVQSVTPSMPGKLNSTCVLVLLFIFKLHFVNTTIVSLMYSVEYTYQGFIQWEASPGFAPRILGVE